MPRHAGENVIGAPSGSQIAFNSAVAADAVGSSRWVAAAASAEGANEVDAFAALFPPTPAQWDSAAIRAARAAAMSDEELEAELFGPGA
jgi:hypothetical protein